MTVLDIDTKTGDLHAAYIRWKEIYPRIPDMHHSGMIVVTL
jgi:hypothetical protein